MDLGYLLVGAMVLSLALLQLNQKISSPILAIINRWLRWFIFSFTTGYLLFVFTPAGRPLWVFVSISCLFWLFCETVYNWLAISALSQSPLPLFPSYAINPSGDEWPANPKYLQIRDWLRQNGFKPIQALRAEIGPGIFLRVSVHDNPNTHSRIQLLFIPQPQGNLFLSAIITTELQSGKRIITDNLHIPFGGFYPQNWFVERRLWNRSIKTLLNRHLKRLKDFNEASVPLNQLPLKDIETTQRDLDRFNTEMGFLVPMHEREEFGKISQAGRYRVWKEIWMLEYLGKSIRYY